MGRGSSKAGGAGGNSAALGVSDRTLTANPQTQEDFIEDIAQAMAKKTGPEEFPMSNGDMQGVVEAFTLSNGGDDDEIIEAIRTRTSQINAENDIYDLKKPTSKTVQEKLSAAPDGTTIAYSTGNGNTYVYEKVGKSAFGDSWMQTTMHSDGSISTAYDRGTVVNAVKDLSRLKYKTGLTAEQRKKYNKKGKELIRDYRGMMRGEM